ncbi:cation diffusion facilitator family transporter [Propionicicella superfundia]|uniref:cation diffusion facilitator family transporter n=1 Tax=Propionicicella superfundia TaxID=348582 RepID=UPI0003FEB65D|nr:cation diffusion facilitator family transporter [Propionicicella superfundia]
MVTQRDRTQTILERYIWLSIATAVATLTLKAVAAWITGSVGLASDALESTVNLVAALVALWALRLAARPADHNHDFGHGKAEYVSAGVEGAMIFVAAVLIVVSAVDRIVNPAELEQPGLGLLLSTVASLLNLGTGLLLIRAGRRHRSITLVADGKHLMTDVWTSAGVLAAVGLIVLTGWQILDPLIAIAVAVNILFTGYRLVRRSIVGLLDATLPPEEVALVRDTLDRLATDNGVEVANVQTRESGRQRFVNVTILVPGQWTVRRSHDLADAIESAVDEVLPETTTFVHVEPAPSP